MEIRIENLKKYKSEFKEKEYMALKELLAYNKDYQHLNFIKIKFDKEQREISKDIIEYYKEMYPLVVKNIKILLDSENLNLTSMEIRLNSFRDIRVERGYDYNFNRKTDELVISSSKHTNG